jgi:hypothetical protein
MFSKLDSIRAIFDRLEYWKAMVAYAQSRAPREQYAAYQSALVQFEEAASLAYQPLFQTHIVAMAAVALSLQRTPEALMLCLKGIDYQNKHH